jgi:hypothetical protein
MTTLTFASDAPAAVTPGTVWKAGLLATAAAVTANAVAYVLLVPVAGLDLQIPASLGSTQLKLLPLVPVVVATAGAAAVGAVLLWLLVRFGKRGLAWWSALVTAWMCSPPSRRWTSTSPSRTASAWSCSTCWPPGSCSSSYAGGSPTAEPARRIPQPAARAGHVPAAPRMTLITSAMTKTIPPSSVSITVHVFSVCGTSRLRYG